jgi:rhodanese-related sulfurtransferase
MQLPTLDPTNAKYLMDQGALLIDIREADEHARERIPCARHVPLSKLDAMELGVADGKTMIFHCRSGARTMANALRLANKAGNARQAFIIKGGLDAWKKAGLPVLINRRQPLELQRQMQIGAGLFALIGSLLGFFISAWFFAIPAFVGAGLITAGVTDFCGMTRILMRLSWNRAVHTSRSQSV